MPWKDVLCTDFRMPTLCRRSSSRSLTYRFLVGLMRNSARHAPHSVNGLRMLCDRSVPTALVRKDVSYVPEVVKLPPDSVEMRIEWVLPKPSTASWIDMSCWGVARSSPPQHPQHPWGPKTPDKVILYLHGGAYLLCTPASLRGITFSLSGALQAPLCVLEYRRPPEHPIPAPMEDAVAAYRYLLETLPGVDIILAGDSAGGGIAAAMLCKLRETNLPMPRCSILISPWTDLGIDGLRHATLENEQHDYLPISLVGFCAASARGALDHDDWQASPLHVTGSLDNLPPIMVVYGEDEILSGQIEKFCSTWENLGADIKALSVKGGVHAPLLFHHVWKPAADAFHEVSFFAEVHCSQV